MTESTDLKAAESAPFLEFKSLYDSAVCGLLSFDLSGKIHYINQTLLDWLELKSSDVKELVFPDLLEKGSALYYQLFVYPLLSMHGEVREISLKLKTANPGLQCLFSARADRTYDGKSMTIHAVLYQMIDRKKYEDELRLRKEKAELETQQKTETLKKVASDQSHLVRAPLANVLGLVSLLEQAGTNEESKELLAMLKESATELDRVITNIVVAAND